MILAEVLIYLRDRHPLFLRGAVIHEIALDKAVAGYPTRMEPSVWESLAEEILRRTGSNATSSEMLAAFLSVEGRVSMRVMGKMFGVTPRGALALIADTLNSGNLRSPVWSFLDHDLVLPVMVTSDST